MKEFWFYYVASGDEQEWQHTHSMLVEGLRLYYISDRR